jgi:hypothetical protein
MDLKTAKDLPPGAEVQGHWTTWIKDRPGRPECWTSSSGDYLSDGQIDRLLGEGAQIVFIPTGAGAARSSDVGRE